MTKPLLVIGLGGHTTREVADRLRDRFTDDHPGVDVVIVGNCTALTVVIPEEIDR